MKFMENYTEANAILLPGRIPGYKRDDLKLLPCDLTKKVSEHTITDNSTIRDMTFIYMSFIISNLWVEDRFALNRISINIPW